jgi:hypothetical protein
LWDEDTANRTPLRVMIILEAICIIVFVCVGLLIVIPIPEFIFRVLFPFRWMTFKIRKIDKIMTNNRKCPSEIRHIINCLFPAYTQLFERASKALLEIGEPAVKYLIQAYPYKPCDEFGDFTTCIYNRSEERMLRNFFGPNKKVEMIFSKQVLNKGIKTQNRFRVLKRLGQLRMDGKE